MIRLLLLLLLGTVYAQEPEYCFEDDVDELVNPSSQEDDNDVPEDPEEMDPKDLKLEMSHNTSLECDSEATCHYRLYTRGKSFSKAQTVCKSHKGNLCSIRNSCINSRLRAFVRRYNQKLAWIGVWKPSCCGYRNIDGQKLKYTNFARRQRKTLGRWCVALNVATGKWISVSCSKQLPYICKL
ncbi:unnamed protein product [Staurois parvus]|uniref:C-type lectin domain-containing protein n=1 Tax=Staurois parvus TaxID=386267 RepID=A0ABN9GE00_9NEOB|nr:unnamed protein product [Staurois parvus]